MSTVCIRRRKSEFAGHLYGYDSAPGKKIIWLMRSEDAALFLVNYGSLGAVAKSYVLESIDLDLRVYMDFISEQLGAIFDVATF